MPRTVNVNYVTKEVKILLHDSETESLAAATAIAAAAEAQEAKDVVVDNLQDSLDAIDAKTEEEKSELDGYTEEKKAEVSTVGQGYVDSASQKVAEANTILSAIRNEYGYPFTAATAADMTDTSKIYVYVGSEIGYVNGNWYYYDGTAWVSGGVYNSTALETDITLSVSGMAADSKEVGDKLKSTVIGGYTYITNSSKEAICNGTLDNIPINTIYTVNHDVLLTNTPTRADGTQITDTYGVVTLSCSNTRANRLGQFQIIVTIGGESWIRGYGSAGWSAWQRIDTNNALIGDGTITDSNKTSICGGSFDGIPCNTIYSVASSVTLTNAPTTFSSVYTIITLSDSKNRGLAAGTLQYCVENGGSIYYRMYTGSWSAWKNLLEDAVTSKGIASAADYSGSLINIISNGIYFVDPDDYDDAPIYNSTNCTLLVFKINASFVLQMFIGTASYGKYVYQRIVRTNGTVYRDWVCVGDAECRSVLAIGDSICNGGRNSNKGFIGDVGVPYVNAGISNARLSTGGSYWIEQELLDCTETSFDAIIMEGGINDYMTHVPLGTLSTVPIKTSDTAAINALDLTTVLGALEHLFISCIAKYPNADRFFLITHKVNHLYNGVRTYYPAHANSAGYTQTELHDAIVNACKLYNVQIIDIFADSPLNTIFDEYVSPTAWEDDHSITDLYWVDHDGLHPLDYGYIHGYVPMIRKALKATSHK